MPHTTSGTPALPTELPVEKVAGATKGVEEGAGGVGGTIATGLGPVFGPLDVILVGGSPETRVTAPLGPVRSRFIIGKN